MAEVAVVTDDTFQQEVLDATNKVVVDFWAPWCGPCKAVGPEIKRLAEKHSDVAFVKLNVDDAPNVAAKYNVMSIPTIGLFEGGNLVTSTVGAKSAEQLEKALGII